MKRSRNKIIVLVMLLAMIVGTLGAAVPMVQSTAQNQMPVERVREVVALRETNSETYLLSNGNYECVVYAGDKYYRDNRNALKLIDNTLILDEATAKTEKRHYKNAANSFQVTFSDSDTPTVTMAKDGLGISFRAESASGGNPFQTASTQKAVTVGAVRNCDTLTQLTDTGTDTITYANAFYNTDLVYVLQNNALKEYIVLKNADAPNAITFRFSTEGLTLTESEGIGLFLDESKNEVFRLDRLFAVDGNGDMTEELSYTFASVKGSRDILVTVTLDAEYLAAEDRAFPVVIDPSVMISSAQTADASVYSGYPDTNYQMEKRLRTGCDTTYGTRRIYIQFQIPSSVRRENVTGATLDIKKHSGSTPSTRAYRCTSYWHSGTITWNNKPDYTMENLSSQSVQRSSGSSWYQMDVTLIVQSWLDMTRSHYGFVVRDNSEHNEDKWTTFYSSDAPSPNKPELHIIYTGDDDSGDSDTDDPIIETTEEIEPENPDNAPSVQLYLFYDEEYVRKYPNAYDHLLAQAELLKAFYLEEFALYITVYGPSPFQSYPEVTDPSTDTLNCTNATYDPQTMRWNFGNKEDPAHHYTNAYNVLAKLPEPGRTDSIHIAFIGHDVCRKYIKQENGILQEVHEYNSNTTNQIFGLALPAFRITSITDPRRNGQEIVTIIHELGHHFLAPDHNDPTIALDDGFSHNCIYGKNSVNYQSYNNITICDGCRQTILNHINLYTSNSGE